LKRIIQNLCEDFLSEQILMGNIVENEEISLVFEENELKISKNSDN
jgi:ATP-dependent Clp protease ATP-binding subunit ClpA